MTRDGYGTVTSEGRKGIFICRLYTRREQGAFFSDIIRDLGHVVPIVDILVYDGLIKSHVGSKQARLGSLQSTRAAYRDNCGDASVSLRGEMHCFRAAAEMDFGQSGMKEDVLSEETRRHAVTSLSSGMRVISY